MATSIYDVVETGAKAQMPAEAGIAGPMTFWILVLVIGMVLKILLVYISMPQQLHLVLDYAGTFILSGPGRIILPVIAGAVIGRETGKRSETLRQAARYGLIDGVYASVTYGISIAIIYEIMSYLSVITQQTLADLALLWLGLPVAVVILTAELFSFLSYSSKK